MFRRQWIARKKLLCWRKQPAKRAVRMRRQERQHRERRRQKAVA